MFTIRYLLDHYGWDKCIEVFGWNPYMLSEGLALDMDKQSVSEEELDKLEGRILNKCKHSGIGLLPNTCPDCGKYVEEYSECNSIDYSKESK